MLVLAGVAASANAQAVKVPEGTEVRLQVLEKLTSANATEGQRFDLELEQDLKVGDRMIAAHGTKAVGTVVSVHKRGRMGKAGELNVQVNYLLVGDQRLPLRASSGKEGDDKVGATVALTVLFGPIGLLKRGKDVELNPGTVFNAVVDATTEITPAATGG
jgi:hypothetical protein